MFSATRHASDEELLQFIDRELPTNQWQSLREHLESCPDCHTRHASIEGRLKALDAFYNSESVELTSAATTSRIELQMKLAKSRKSRSRWQNLMPKFRPGIAAAAMATLAILGFAFYGGKSKHSGPNSAEQFLVPNRALTPGAVRSVSLSEVCSVNDDDLDPKVSLSTEMAVLKEYGLPSDVDDAQKYQIDYLVNPQLGGTNDIKNLWPQPYSTGAWNAHAKDLLEQHLHHMVCNRTVNLAEAQQEIASNWIAAYKKYIGREGS
ncbi:MAG TPA: hypothetical protein VHB45_11765 [Alloacidobacterium sp.]|nr:hypothetical protein [Alloacidobacterium sp.]